MRKYLLNTIIIIILLSSVIISQEKEVPPVPEIPGFEVSEQQEKESLSKLNERLRKQLEDVKRLNKFKYNEMLHNLYFRSMDFPVFSENDKKSRERSKKIMELEIDTEALGVKYQSEKGGDKQKIKDELRVKLNDLFELRESERKEEFESLEKRLNELRESLSERRKNKDEIVKNRMRELTGEEKHMRW